MTGGNVSERPRANPQLPAIGGASAAVGVDDPRRLALAVEQVLVVEPLDLVVERARLGQSSSRLPVLRSSTREAPDGRVRARPPSCKPIRVPSGDSDGHSTLAWIVSRRACALIEPLISHVLSPGARPSRRTCRRRRRTSGPSSCGRAPSIELAVVVDLEVLLEVADDLAGAQVEDRRRGRELAGLRVGVAGQERGHAAPAAVGRDPRAARDARDRVAGGPPSSSRRAGSPGTSSRPRGRGTGRVPARKVTRSHDGPGEHRLARALRGQRRDREAPVVGRVLAVERAEGDERLPAVEHAARVRARRGDGACRPSRVLLLRADDRDRRRDDGRDDAERRRARRTRGVRLRIAPPGGRGPRAPSRRTRPAANSVIAISTPTTASTARRTGSRRTAA